MQWTKEMCADLAAQCGTRTEFSLKHKNAYTAAWAKGWLDEICAHMPKRSPRPMVRWPEDRVSEILSQYSDYAKFRQEQYRLWRILHSRGDLDARTAHMHREKAQNGYWDKERCAEAALKFETRTDFQRGCLSGYDAAYNNDWMDEICAHMRVRGNRHLRAVYILRAKSTRKVYVGLSFDPDWRHRGHVRKPTPAVKALLDLPHTMKVMTGFLPTHEAQALERRLIARFKNAGWDVANLRRGGEPGGGVVKWTRETLQAVADECETRGAMLKQYSGAYSVASKLNLIDALFENHTNQGFREDIAADYTVEQLREIARQHPDRLAFKTEQPNAWQGAYRLGCLDEIFKDHPNQGLKGRPDWTEDELRAVAADCRTAGELLRRNKNAYRAALRRGLLRVLYPKPPSRKG